MSSSAWMCAIALEWHKIKQGAVDPEAGEKQRGRQNILDSRRISMETLVPMCGSHHGW